VSFFDIFEKTVCKAEMVATFLALLELIRVKEVLIKQEDTFDEIIITSRL
jgi:segregation and condensation protein A